MLKDCQTTPPRATVQDGLGWDGRGTSTRQSDCALQVQDIPDNKTNRRTCAVNTQVGGYWSADGGLLLATALTRSQRETETSGHKVQIRDWRSWSQDSNVVFLEIEFFAATL